MQDEETLIRRAQQHDQAALSRIYEEHFDKIYRYIALKIGDRTEAEDMTQQVFLKAFKSISSYRSKGNPITSWLFRIAHNQVVDYYRRRSKRPTVPIEEALTRSSDDDPGVEAERKLTIEKLAGATAELTRLQQEVISLRFAGELSVAEAAKIMGKSEGAIKALQHSAIASLRRLLSGA